MKSYIEIHVKKKNRNEISNDRDCLSLPPGLYVLFVSKIVQKNIQRLCDLANGRSGDCG